MASEESEFHSHSEVVQRFVSMRDGVEALWNKINELRNEVSEHEQVLKALEPMEPSRRCYRLVGSVLVEGTVGEAIPDIQQREQGLQAVLAKLGEQLERDRTALAAFQKKYKIRVKGEESAEDDVKEKSQAEGGDGGPSSSQGVLVSSS